MEALPIDQSDVVQSLEEAVGIVREIDSPGVRTMFDVHNAIPRHTAAESLREKRWLLTIPA